MKLCPVTEQPSNAKLCSLQEPGTPRPQERLLQNTAGMQCCQSAPGRLSNAEIGLQEVDGLSWEDAGSFDSSFDADTQQEADPFAAEEQELLSSAPLDAMLALQLLQHQFPAKAKVSAGAVLASFAVSRGSLMT